MSSSASDTPAGTRPLRLVLIDDHELLRVGLKTALSIEPNLEIVGEAASGAEAIPVVSRSKPDVVLLDLLLGDIDGIHVCRELKTRWPELKVLMLTSSSDDQAVLASILAGASGYLLKNISRAELIWAIVRAARGELLLDPAVAKKVTERLVHRSAEVSGAAELSEREREVLALVARGLTNKQIADRLIIAEKTARNHVSHILEKLNLSRRSEAAAFAARLGLDRDE